MVDEQDHIPTVGAPTEVRFLCFTVCQTLPDEQDPVSTTRGRTEGRFLHYAVRQTSFRLFRPSQLAPNEQDTFRPSRLPPDEHDVVSSVATQPVGRQ